MKSQLPSILCTAVLLATLSGCGFVSTQLADKANEDRLLKPGALDKPLTGYFDTYSVKFLDRYRLTHEWPVVSNCEYRKLETRSRPQSYMGDVYIARDIYEADQRTWQRFDPELGPFDFDRFVRSQKKQQPIFKSGRANVIERYEETEEGFQPLCFEAWVRTSHALTLMLHRRSLAEWDARLRHWNQGAFAGPTATRLTQDVRGNTWHVYRVPLMPRSFGRISGPFELHILPIGDTEYTLALELGATQESLQHPEAHARFLAMFQHLIESVRIEPLTPAIEAEIAQLKSRAIEVQRQDCVEWARREKPPAWCEKYLSR